MQLFFYIKYHTFSIGFMSGELGHFMADKLFFMNHTIHCDMSVLEHYLVGISYLFENQLRFFCVGGHTINNFLSST